MIQVRNVPRKLHAELVRRARLKGVTLTAYIQGILEREVGRPEPSEVFARIEGRRGRLPDSTSDEIVAIIREMRGPIPPA